MSATRRAVGQRARWPDVVIALGLVALAVVGVAALFGPAIKGWLSDGDTLPAATQPDQAPSPTL